MASEGPDRADAPSFHKSAMEAARRLVRNGQLESASAQALVENAEIILDMYYGGDPAGFLALYRKQGLQPVSKIEGPQDLEWKTASISGHKTDADGIRIIRVTSDGGLLAIPGLPGELIHRIGPAQPRGPGDFDLTGNTLSEARVVGIAVPTMFSSTEGKPFEGLLVLYLARREDDGEWILIQIEARAVTRPQGAAEGRPPGIFTLPL